MSGTGSTSRTVSPGKVGRPWVLATGCAGLFLATVLLRSQGSTALLVGLVVAGLVCLWLRVQGGLSPALILLVLLPFHFYSPVGPRTLLSFADFVLPLVAIELVLSARRRKRDSAGARGRISPKLAMVLLWLTGILVVISVSLLVASARFPGAPIGDGVVGAIKIAVMGTYLLLVMATYDRQGGIILLALKVWAITSTWVAAGAIVAVALYAVGLPTSLSYQFRATGPFEDPNAFAVYIMISLGLSMCHQWITRGRVLSPGIVLLFLALLLSASRAAFAAGVVAALISILAVGGGRAARAYRRGLVGVFVAGVIAFAVLPQEITRSTLERGLSAFDAAGVGDDVRFLQWDAATALWANHPVVGVGLGQFRHAAGQELGYQTEILVHNTYLSVLAELGTVGGVVLLGIWVAAAARVAGPGRALGQARPFLLFAVLATAIMAATLNLENNRTIWLMIALVLLSRARWVGDVDSPAESSQGHDALTRRSGRWPVHVDAPSLRPAHRLRSKRLVQSTALSTEVPK